MGTNPKRLYLIALALVMLATAAALLIHRPQARQRPRDREALARWLAAHPADWIAASVVTDRALDMPVRERVALWRAARQHAERLAPYRQNARVAFVRAGLFHWYELGEADRRDILNTAAPLLRDEQTFRDLHKPLWDLTNDFAFLRRANPNTAESLATLRDLAATHGRWDDYRAMRRAFLGKMAQELHARAPSMTSSQLASFFTDDLNVEHRPLVARVLEELNRRPLHDQPEKPEAFERLTEFAARHGLQPSGPISSEPTGWTGLCSSNICVEGERTVTLAAPRTARLVLAPLQTDEVPPYVEIYVDDVRVAEGTVERERAFELPMRAGTHLVEVQLVNPWTRNRIRRIVRIASDSFGS